MFTDFKSQTESVVLQILKKHSLEAEIILEEPPSGFGELATPICFDLASVLKKSPKDIAEEFTLAADISKASFIRAVKAVNGYLNFYLDYEKFTPILIKELRALDKDYGRMKKKEKVILEHTSANPDGALHIGHGRNAVIGDTLARIMRFAGYDVETQFYVNDMGKQLAIVVFGLRKLKLDRSKKKDHAIAEVYAKANSMLEEDASCEEEISKLLRDYEDGDEGVKKEFEDASGYCLEGIKETLGRMGVTYDSFVWESRFVRDLSVKKILDRLKKVKYAKSEEVLYLDLKSFGIDKELILTRKDGTYLYTTRDIAYHIWKSEKGMVIDVLGADHKLVAKQLQAVMKILGEREPEFILYEFISLPTGSMSTRRGVYISVDDLLDESVRRAYAEVDKRRPDEGKAEKSRIAEKVGIGAVRYNISRISPEKGMVFKWEEALDFERQGSPFIQYAHARACRILEKAEVASEFDVHKLSETEEHLVLEISKFPGVVEEAALSRRPSLLANYALGLAEAFHRFYKFEPVLKSEEKDFRLNLVLATRSALRNALQLLGIEALEKM